MVNGNKLRLEGMVAGMASLKMLRASEEGTAVSAEEIGVRLAHKMTGMGASEFIAEGRAK
jgi:porphobilinogen deaminase